MITHTRLQHLHVCFEAVVKFGSTWKVSWLRIAILSNLTCIMWSAFIMWISYYFTEIRMKWIISIDWFINAFTFTQVLMSAVYLGAWWTNNIPCVRVALVGSLLNVRAPYICDFLQGFELLMLCLFDLVLWPCRVLSLWWLNHDGALGEHHLRGIFAIVSPSVFLNLLYLIDLRLSVVNWLYFKGMVVCTVSHHCWGVCLIKLLWTAHYEVMLLI